MLERKQKESINILRFDYFSTIYRFTFFLLGYFHFFYNSTGIKNQSPLFGKVRDKPICVSVTGAIQATAQFTLPRLRCLRGVA